MVVDVLCSVCKIQFTINDNVILDFYYSLTHESCFGYCNVSIKDTGNYLDVILRHQMLYELIPFDN